MGLPAKLVRAQLHIMKPIAANLSLEATRKGQDKLGEIMEAIHRRDVFEREHDFGAFQGAWLMPKDERRHFLSSNELPPGRQGLPLVQIAPVQTISATLPDPQGLT